jgi:hypothetical protein
LHMWPQTQRWLVATRVLFGDAWLSYPSGF